MVLYIFILSYTVIVFHLEKQKKTLFLLHLTSCERLFSRMKFILNELCGNYSEEWFVTEAFISFYVDKVITGVLDHILFIGDELRDVFQFIFGIQTYG